MPLLTAVIIRCSRCPAQFVTSVQRGTNPDLRVARPTAAANGWHCRRRPNKAVWKDYCPACRAVLNGAPRRPDASD